MMSKHLIIKERGQLEQCSKLLESVIYVHRRWRAIKVLHVQIQAKPKKKIIYGKFQNQPKKTLWYGMVSGRIVGPFIFHKTMNEESILACCKNKPDQ